MKYLYFIFITSIIYSLSACAPPSKQEEKVISVSIDPQKYFLEQIVGNKFTVNTAIPSGSNPETYDPSPSQMVNIGRSQIYFKVGNLGFENTWLNNISANNPSLKIIDCSTGIKVIADDHGHPNGDPHIWSSTKTALTVSTTMYNAMIEADPKNKDFYLDRFKNLERTIQQTDSIVKHYLSEAPSKSFIIYHPALSYFAEQYGLKQYSIEVEGKAPTPQQIAQLVKKAKLENIKVIFVQEEYDIKNAEPIAKETGAKLVTINPLSYNWNEELIKIAKAISDKYNE